MPGGIGVLVAVVDAVVLGTGIRSTGPPTHDLATICQWVVPDNYPVNLIWPASPDYDRAFVVQIDYPLIAQVNACDVLLAAPDQCGGWSLWALR